MAADEERYFAAEESDMLEFGASLASQIEAPCVVYLQGDLGVGKTTLTRGFLRGLGYDDKVKSPTYTIVETYQLDQLEVHHFDLYRIVDSSELEFLGMRECCNDDAILLIEWPEKAKSALPPADLICDIKYEDGEGNGREICLTYKK